GNRTRHAPRWAARQFGFLSPRATAPKAALRSLPLCARSVLGHGVTRTAARLHLHPGFAVRILVHAGFRRTSAWLWLQNTPNEWIHLRWDRPSLGHETAEFRERRSPLVLLFSQSRADRFADLCGLFQRNCKLTLYLLPVNAPRIIGTERINQAIRRGVVDDTPFNSFHVVIIGIHEVHARYHQRTVGEALLFEFAPPEPLIGHALQGMEKFLERQPF